MLGDAKGPAQLGAGCRCVGMRELANHVARHAGDLLRSFERVAVDGCGVLVEPGRCMTDELLVDQPRCDDLAADGVGQRDVGADIDAQPNIGPLGRLGTARVNAVDAGALMNAFEDVMEEDRVGVARVRTPQNDQVRGLDLFV